MIGRDYILAWLEENDVMEKVLEASLRYAAEKGGYKDRELLAGYFAGRPTAVSDVTLREEVSAEEVHNIVRSDDYRRKRDQALREIDSIGEESA